MRIAASMESSLAHPWASPAANGRTPRPAPQLEDVGARGDVAERIVEPLHARLGHLVERRVVEVGDESTASPVGL